MLIGFVQGYEELKWGISKINPLCNGPLAILLEKYVDFNMKYCLSPYLFTSCISTFAYNDPSGNFLSLKRKYDLSRSAYFS